MNEETKNKIFDVLNKYEELNDKITHLEYNLNILNDEVSKTIRDLFGLANGDVVTLKTLVNLGIKVKELMEAENERISN